MMKEENYFCSKKTAFVFIVSAIVVISTAPMITMATSSWDQFQKDDMHSGVTTELAPVKNVVKAWKVFTHTDDWKMAGIDVMPIVAEGKVLVIDAKGYAWAFDAKSGEGIWNTTLSCNGLQFQLATPAYGDEKVFFATNDGHVYALNPQNGSVIWVNETAEIYDQLNTPVTYADGKVYVGSLRSDNGASETGIYYCLDTSTGDIVWARPSDTGMGYYWAGAMVIGDYLVYGDCASVLTSVYKDNGTFVDTVNLTRGTDVPFNRSDAGTIRSSVTYSQGSVFLTSDGGYLWKIGFNESTGNFTPEGWTREIGYSSSTPIVLEGRVYIGSGTFSTGGTLYCVKEDNGAELWNISVDGGVKASPAISIQDGALYIYFTTNCQNGKAYCVNGSGNELWNFTTEEAGSSEGYILQGVALSDGYVYFGNDGGYLYGLKEAEPSAFWEGEVTLTANTTFNVTAQNSGESYELNRTTALGALAAVAEQGNFNYTLSDLWYASFNALQVDSIGETANSVTEYWLYWVNYPTESSPIVGVNAYDLDDGDVITYYYGGSTATPDNASKVITIHVCVLTP
jgi:outer membrane protein assembly factor BamB